MKRLLTVCLLMIGIPAASQMPKPNWQEEPKTYSFQTICLGSTEMLGRLFSLGERPWISADMSDDNKQIGVLVFWINPNNSNWTVTATLQSTSCILAAGTGFREVTQRPSI